MENNSIEKVIKSHTLYEGRIVNLKVETVELPNKKYAKREIIEHKRGVGILALTDDNKVWMVRQYRSAAKEFLWEIPAGLVENNEDVKQAAARELQEEIGLKPLDLEFLFEAYVSPGFTNEKLSILCATKFEESKLPEDDTEFIEVKLFSLEELYSMVMNFEIVDAKTIIAVLYAVKLRGVQL